MPKRNVTTRCVCIIPDRLAEHDLEPGEAGTVERQGGQQLLAVVPAGDSELGQEWDAVQQPHHTVCTDSEV